MFGWGTRSGPVYHAGEMKRALDRSGHAEALNPAPDGSGRSEETRVLDQTIKRLRSVIGSLRPRFEKTAWTSYAACVTENYDDDAHRRKRSVVDGP